MHPSVTSDDAQKFGAGAAPTDEPPATATGYPVGTMNQPYPPQPPPIQPQGTVRWSTGLCDCGDDVKNCCITCWCPCITFGQISEIVDKGSSSCVLNGVLYTLMLMLVGCACCYSCFYRAKMRSQYSLSESPCADCCVHCFCETCALCQEYRELKSRGFDMSIGNLEKNTPDVQMVPPAPQSGMTMNR